jgi:hypothetical protein
MKSSTELDLDSAETPMHQNLRMTYCGYDLVLTALVMNPEAFPEKWRFIPIVNATRQGATTAPGEDTLLDMGTIVPFNTLEDCYGHAEFMAKRYIDRLLAKK